ncbi:MAG: metallophosphoesterase family protein [Chloroflexota bacterium]
MKVALIADIHGNGAALEMVLAALRQEAPDAIVCLGDVAAVGPQPGEVVAMLRDYRPFTVMGNTDAWLSDPTLLARMSQRLPSELVELNQWSLSRLTPDDIAWLQSFAATVSLDLGGGQTLLAYHGSPNSWDDILLATTPAAEVEQMIAGHGGTVLAGGHTHVAMLRRHGDKLLLNPGSVGSPLVVFPEIRRDPDWVEFALLRCERGNVSVAFRHLVLEAGVGRKTAVSANMPHIDWWAAPWG